MSDQPSFIVPPGACPAFVQDKVDQFLKHFKTHESQHSVPLLVLSDNRHEACYVICHLEARTLAAYADVDAVLDPVESEEYKLNREIYTDTEAYKRMVDDARLGRSFEDIVVEYDTNYRTNKPLKVYGGQHRIEAVKEVLTEQPRVAHGVRVYFNLTTDQRLDIATANNTSIAVPNDLLDRMQEESLGAALRDWCQAVGLLNAGQNFADRRSSEGIPTVRVARTLIVNFHIARNASNGAPSGPVVCRSGGVDTTYKNAREEIDWSDEGLIRMGVEFARLHSLQRERVLGRTNDKYLEFAIKAIHPCVAASWAYASGHFQNDAEALNAHYALADACNAPNDPLNAKALQNARLKGVDDRSYRGLGARISTPELGRMLEVFLLQAKDAPKRGINDRLANAAIVSYEAKQCNQDRERAIRKL